MSYEDHAAARRVKGLRGITRDVFLEIAFRTSNDDHHECSVKVGTLAEAIGRSEKAVRVAIHEIRGVGLVNTSRRARKNGTRSCFKFKLVMPFPHEVVVPKKPTKYQKPAVNDTAQPAVNGTALLSGSSSDQGFFQKIEAAAAPGPFPSTEDPEAEKTPEKIPTGIEPPDSAHAPTAVGAVISRYRKTPTATAFLACMHELRKHLGLKALDKFPKADYMNVPELFDLLGSPTQAFDALADFAETWAKTTGKRPHFGPRQVFQHFYTPKFAGDMAVCKKSESDPCDELTYL